VRKEKIRMRRKMKGRIHGKERRRKRWKVEFIKMKDETKEDREEMKKELKELRKRKKRWREEKEELVKLTKGLQLKVKELKKKESGNEREGIQDKKEEEKRERRLKEIERKLEKKEREEKRKNLIIRRVKVKERRRREAVDDLMKEIGVVMKVKEVWKIAGDKKKGREIVEIKIEEEEKRREIWSKKKNLRGRKKRIHENWTWKERKMKWKLKETARLEERKGRKVWLGYGKIRIDEQSWRWNEGKEILVDGKGNRREEKRGNG